MKVLRHYLQTLGLVLLIVALSYGRVDWAVPYILPVTVIGVIGILTYAIITFKRRGWMVVALALVGGLLMTKPAEAAYQMVDCGGQHNGKSTIELLLEGSIVSGTAQAMKDAVLGGNVFTSEFASDAIMACVIVNCINAAAEMCNPSGDTYDAAIRANAFYVLANVRRMSVDAATDNADGVGWGNDWIGDHMNNGTAEQRAAYQRASSSSIKDASSAKSCAEEYIEHCAEIDKKNEATCRTVAQNVVQHVKNCWVCTIVDAFLLSVQRVAGIAYIALKEFAVDLLGVIFLFWIAAKVLRLIAGMGYDDHGSFLTEFLIRCITVMIAVAILHTPIVNLYSIVVSPFIQMTAGLTTTITESALQDANGRSFFETVNAELGSPMVSRDPKQNCLQHCENMKNSSFKYSQEQLKLMDLKEDEVVLDAQSYSGLMCLACRAYTQVTPFTAIGESFSCYSVKHGSNILSWLGLPLGTIPLFDYFLVGLAITASFGFVTLFLSFYIVDIVWKLGFTIVLTPLLVVAWAFPISRDYATRGWNLLIYCLAEFVGLAIMMALYMVIFMNMFQAVPGASGSVENQIVSLMRADNVSGLFDLFNGFMFPLKLIVVTFMAVKMVQGVGQMVSLLTGVSPGIPSVAMAVLGGLVQQGMELAGIGGGAAGKMAHGAAKKMGSKLSGVAGRRNSSGGRMQKDGGPTNTSQRAAQGMRSFSEKSRQAGTSVSQAGTSLQSKGLSMSAAGADMMNAGKALAAQGGLKNRLKGGMMQAKGAMQTVGGMAKQMAGTAINPAAKAVGDMMNKAGTAVAGLSDKMAGKLQSVGDKRQQEKEASLRADPKAAAQREHGYGNIQRGGKEMSNGNIARGLGMIIRGGASVVASKARRMGNHHQRNAKRLNRGRSANYRRSV